MKKLLTKIFGINFLRYIRGITFYIKNIRKIIFKNKIIVNEKIVDNIKCYKLYGRNVFNGYYDIVPIKDNKLLFQYVNKFANTQKNISTIGFFDLNTNKMEKVCATKAWCWQQGSRLRWSKDNNIIIYNDCINNTYCTLYYDISEKKIIRTIPYALYDINKNETYGISLNFSRLQRLRPGYGYNILEDYTKNEKCPKNDGLIYIDLKNNESKLLVSLYDLAININDYEKYDHYINHVSISPNGKKIMFFHLFSQTNNNNWKANLMVINSDGTNLSTISENVIVSHYDWYNDDAIIVTCKLQNNNIEYRIYNLKNNNYKIINNQKLNRDGHPTVFNNGNMFSDTYPDNEFYQHLFLYNLKNNKYQEILKIFATPILWNEMRCDLHPKITDDQRKILIDTTYKKTKRSILLVDLKDEVLKSER